jgi:hypothetical protein
MELTESPIVNEWIEQAGREAELKGVRSIIIRVLKARFPGQATKDIIDTINHQPSLEVLGDWIDHAAVQPLEKFREYLRR